MAKSGAPPRVDHVKKEFLEELQSAAKLIAAVNSLKGGINPKGPKALHPKYVRQVIELAFMGAVASWEEFLERCLVRYVAGAKAASGYAPSPRFGLATSLEHAYQVLSTNPSFDATRDYLKVSEPKWVASTAEFHFSAHPFGIVKQNSQLLLRATAIRNRVAHSSTKCRKAFKEVALEFLSPPSGKLSQGYGPGDLLGATVQRHFGQAVSAGQKTHWEAYFDLFRGMAQKIVP